MKKYSKEVTVAVIVLMSIGLFYFGMNYLKGIDIFSQRLEYHAVYQHIDGLSADNSVTLNGFKVGKVTDVTLNPDQSGTIIVNFAIFEKNLQIPKGSVAKIVSLDLLGTKAISLELSDSSEFAENRTELIAANEQDLQSAVDERIKPLEQKTKELLGSIDSAVVVVQSILNKEARENLSASFESIKRSFEIFEKTALKVDNLVAAETEKISGIITNLHSITTNLKNNNRAISNVMNNFSTISDSLAQVDFAETMQNASVALKSTAEIMDKINHGEGTIGMLVHNDTLYTNLENTAEDLDLLLEDMRINPKRYVHFSIFGRKDKNKPQPRPR